MTQHIAPSKRRSGSEAKVNRSGEPLQVYFRAEQRQQLRALSREHRIAESELVRGAVDSLLARWRSTGQLTLPLGLKYEP